MFSALYFAQVLLWAWHISSLYFQHVTFIDYSKPTPIFFSFFYRVFLTIYCIHLCHEPFRPLGAHRWMWENLFHHAIIEISCLRNCHISRNTASYLSANLFSSLLPLGPGGIGSILRWKRLAKFQKRRKRGRNNRFRIRWWRLPYN